MRGSWISVGSALIALFAFLPVGCGDSGGPTGTGSGGSSGTGGSGGTGGSTGSSMTGTGGTGGTMMTPCMAPTDCPGEDSVCGTRTCVNGVCGMDIKMNNVDLPSQIYGDCQTVKCDDKGNLVVANDDTDVYDDGNACTEDLCMNGTASNDPKMGMCGPPGAFCNMQAMCVECLSDSDCTAITAPNCTNGKCVPDLCKNMTKDTQESDVDCGGPCAPCADTMGCKAGTDCVSGVCQGATPSTKTCQPASCGDGIKNGNETDVDCGGAECLAQGAPCLDSWMCKSPADCESGVCKSGVCEAPSCTDGVQNGMETGVDCGGGCPACP